MDACHPQRRRPGHVVAVVGVAAVDHDVIGVEQRHERSQRGLHDPGREHDPDIPRAVELARQFLEGIDPIRALANQRLHYGRGSVVGHAAVPVAHQPPHEVRSHPAQPDHAELHWLVSRHVRRLAVSAGRPHPQTG
jgi:hypothetical protein